MGDILTLLAGDPSLGARAATGRERQAEAQLTQILQALTQPSAPPRPTLAQAIGQGIGGLADALAASAAAMGRNPALQTDFARQMEARRVGEFQQQEEQRRTGLAAQARVAERKAGRAREERLRQEDIARGEAAQVRERDFQREMIERQENFQERMTRSQQDFQREMQQDDQAFQLAIRQLPDRNDKEALMLARADAEDLVNSFLFGDPDLQIEGGIESRVRSSEDLKALRGVLLDRLLARPMPSEYRDLIISAALARFDERVKPLADRLSKQPARGQAPSVMVPKTLPGLGAAMAGLPSVEQVMDPQVRNILMNPQGAMTTIGMLLNNLPGLLNRGPTSGGSR